MSSARAWGIEPELGRDPALGRLLELEDDPGDQHRPGGPDRAKAHYAVIGDPHEVVPAINAELRKRLG